MRDVIRSNNHILRIHRRYRADRQSCKHIGIARFCSRFSRRIHAGGRQNEQQNYTSQRTHELPVSGKQHHQRRKNQLSVQQPYFRRIIPVWRNKHSLQSQVLRKNQFARHIRIQIRAVTCCQIKRRHCRAYKKEHLSQRGFYIYTMLQLHLSHLRF